MGYPDIFWDKQTKFVCTDCGYVMTSLDHSNVKRKMSELHGINMDFFACPNCGKEAIVLW